MKSPNKLVVSLLMGMLTVSSVYPTSSVFSWRNLGKLVSSAADSSVAQVLLDVGHKVIDHPLKTSAALTAVIIAVGAYRYWDNPTFEWLRGVGSSVLLPAYKLCQAYPFHG